MTVYCPLLIDSVFAWGGGASRIARAGERYGMGLRMGGTRAGKEVGEHLMEARIGEYDDVKRVLRTKNSMRKQYDSAKQRLRYGIDITCLRCYPYDKSIDR